MSTSLDITDLDPSVAQAEGMDYVFTPPALISDNPRLTALFHETVDRMRREAEGIALATNQILLLSKIARDFCIMMYYDEVGWQSQGTNARKDSNQQWLAMMAEWRNVLKDNQAQMTAKVVDAFVDLSIESLKLIPDDETRKTVQDFQQAQFKKLGY